MLVTDILAGGLCVVWLENLQEDLAIILYFLTTVSFTACENLVKMSIFWSKVESKKSFVLVTRFINNNGTIYIVCIFY